MGPKARADTESRQYYSWNACYVFSANERMKKNKQWGQIKRGKKTEGAECTEAEKELKGGVKRGKTGMFRSVWGFSACSTGWMCLSPTTVWEWIVIWTLCQESQASCAPPLTSVAGWVTDNRLARITTASVREKTWKRLRCLVKMFGPESDVEWEPGQVTSVLVFD